MVNKTSALHDFGHSLSAWALKDTNPWFEFVLHMALHVAPFALILLFGIWILQISRRVFIRRRTKSPMKCRALNCHTGPAGIFGYILKHTRTAQILLVATALVALPLLYAGLELPKLIINNAISSGHFPTEVLSVSLSQTDYLLYQIRKLIIDGPNRAARWT